MWYLSYRSIISPGLAPVEPDEDFGPQETRLLRNVAQIGEDIVSPGKGRLTVDRPLASIQTPEQGWLDRRPERGVLEPGEELTPVKTRDHLDGQEEPRP